MGFWCCISKTLCVHKMAASVGSACSAFCALLVAHWERLRDDYLMAYFLEPAFGLEKNWGRMHNSELLLASIALLLAGWAILLRYWEQDKRTAAAAVEAKKTE